MSIFKACDIRGRYGPALNPEVAERLGLAVGTALAGGRVVVGGDLRPSTAPLKAALIEGLMGSGRHVIDVGVLPTPAFYFAKDYLHAEGGVMVTGSHNPPGDNGFKISMGSWPITEEELASLEQRMVRGDFASGTGRVERCEVVEHYEDFILGRFPSAGGLKVVVDAGNGCYALIAPRILRELGYTVVELHCEPDGSFPGRPPNPAVAANLKLLSETVTQIEANVGVAFDGDGDRVVFVDERGRVVEGERIIVLFARHLLRQQAGEVVYDLKCSSVVPEQVRQAGGVPVIEKSGHAFIKTALLQRRALMAGEISGHFFFGELGRDDGLYATLLLLYILAEEGKGLASLADAVPQYPITPDIRLPCPPDKTQVILRELQRSFSQEADCEISTLDGVRIAWPDGWALIRPSVTEPLVTLRFEAHSERRLAEIRDITLSRSPSLKMLFESG